MFKTMSTAFLAAAMLSAPAALAQVHIGEVDTTFRVLGANDSIVVDRYDDPKVPNVSCYVSRAQTGGFMGSVGLATDKSLFSIACRATGPVNMPAGLPRKEAVFSASASVLFKTITVTRMVDAEKRVLVYLVTSTKVTDGSPFNSVTAVPIDVPATH
jgi:CreA protein